MSAQFNHQTVLLEEAVAALVQRPDGCYVDGTFGRGGHAREILKRLGDGGRLIVIDQDPEAMVVARALQAEDSRLTPVQANFADLDEVLQQHCEPDAVDGILLDLGVSSPQLDDAGRGFSFMRDGPLDMRMDPERGESAADWLQRADEAEIRLVLQRYGEERFARRIARRIVETRIEQPLRTTGELARLIEAAVPRREPGKHPATRSFQAIRIEVNRELEVIERVLPQTLDWLATGGRLVVISFHSLEDRIVKRFLRDRARGERFPAGVPVTQDMLNQELRIVGKAIKPGFEETARNVRARSAVMRVAERIR